MYLRKNCPSQIQAGFDHTMTRAHAYQVRNLIAAKIEDNISHGSGLTDGVSDACAAFVSGHIGAVSNEGAIGILDEGRFAQSVAEIVADAVVARQLIAVVDQLAGVTNIFFFF